MPCLVVSIGHVSDTYPPRLPPSPLRSSVHRRGALEVTTEHSKYSAQLYLSTQNNSQADEQYEVEQTQMQTQNSQAVSNIQTSSQTQVRGEARTRRGRREGIATGLCE